MLWLVVTFVLESRFFIYFICDRFYNNIIFATVLCSHNITLWFCYSLVIVLSTLNWQNYHFWMICSLIFKLTWIKFSLKVYFNVVILFRIVMVNFLKWVVARHFNKCHIILSVKRPSLKTRNTFYYDVCFSLIRYTSIKQRKSN